MILSLGILLLLSSQLRAMEQTLQGEALDYFTLLPEELKKEIVLQSIVFQKSPEAAICAIKALLLTNKKNSQLLKNKEFIGRIIKLLKSHFAYVPNLVAATALFNSATACDWLFFYMQDLATKEQKPITLELEIAFPMFVDINHLGLIQRWYEEVTCHLKHSIAQGKNGQALVELLQKARELELRQAKSLKNHWLLRLLHQCYLPFIRE
jgi:hypothetical protein